MFNVWLLCIGLCVRLQGGDVYVVEVCDRGCGGFSNRVVF